MGRIFQEIDIGGTPRWTLFDTGARNTYVNAGVAMQLETVAAASPIRTKMGGETKEARETAVLNAHVGGLPISTHTLVVDRIGNDEHGRPIDVLIGALAMQQWGIRPVPDEERLDLTHYSSEFVEF